MLIRHLAAAHVIEIICNSFVAYYYYLAVIKLVSIEQLSIFFEMKSKSTHVCYVCSMIEWMNEAILSRSDCKQVVSHTRKLKASYTIPALSIENFIFQDNNETMKQKPSGLIYSFSSSSSSSSLFFILYKKTTR